jgi:hypothetical protein
MRPNRHIKKEKKLFEYIMRTKNFTHDAQLAKFLITSTSIISQVRNDKIPLSARLILRVYDKMGLSVEEIRKMVKEDV